MPLLRNPITNIVHDVTNTKARKLKAYGWVDACKRSATKRQNTIRRVLKQVREFTTVERYSGH